MALSSKNLVLASDFVSLKTRVKAEMNRRCRTGSLTAYAGTAYDYTVAPASGGVIRTEHINKLVEPVNAIAASGYTTSSDGDTVVELDTLNTKLAAHESYPMRGSGTDCASSCSGLCSSGCWNSCSGCGGGCSYSCSGDCDGTCDGCSGTCSGTCSGSCSGTCTGSCSGGCVGCTATCQTCAGVCGNGCGYRCGGSGS